MSAPRAVGATGFWVAPLWLENIIPSSWEESEASWNKRGSKNPRRKEAPLSRTHLHIGLCVCVCTYMHIPAPTTHVIYCLFSLVLELTGNPARKQESQGSFSKITFRACPDVSTELCGPLHACSGIMKNNSGE